MKIMQRLTLSHLMSSQSPGEPPTAGKKKRKVKESISVPVSQGWGKQDYDEALQQIKMIKVPQPPVIPKNPNMIGDYDASRRGPMPPKDPTRTILVAPLCLASLKKVISKSLLIDNNYNQKV